MKLTRSADFALRIVIHLAGEESSTMPELSRNLQVPYNNLSKIVQTLAKGGILETRQGKHGGVRLNADAGSISLKNIIDLIDGPTKLSGCLVNDHDNCVLLHGCKLKSVFSKLQSDINTLFENVKIAELV